MIPKLSIIIPCYNLGEYLHEAIDSIMQYPNNNDIEIIIVNDGSTDAHTLAVLVELENKGITVLHQQNMEVAKARNNGIAIAKANYILPLDADNRIKSIYLSESIRLLEERREIDIIYSNKLEFGIRNQELIVCDFDFPKLCYHNYIDNCAVFRKSIWETVNGYDENMPIYGLEDWDFWLRCALRGANFYHLNEIGYEYRIREDSKTAKIKESYNLILNYMYQKRELSLISDIAKSYEARVELEQMKKSKKYKLINTLLKLFRRKN